MTAWNNIFSKRYKATEKSINDKIFSDPELFLEGSFLLIEDKAVRGMIVTKINKGILKEYTNCAWITTLFVDEALQNNHWGGKLLYASEEALFAKGVRKILLGGDMSNFFSGIPDPNEYKKVFFEKKGYCLNEESHYDLMEDVSLIDFEKLKVSMNNSQIYKTVQFKMEYYSKLKSFFDSSFPGRWKQEMLEYIATANEEASDLLIMLCQDKIIGFCKVFTGIKNTSCFGGLGPIGLNEEYRGKGLGNRLLKDSLQILKERGAGDVLIDWTILKDFYGQFGFKPFRTYLGGYKIYKD